MARNDEDDDNNLNEQNQGNDHHLIVIPPLSVVDNIFPHNHNHYDHHRKNERKRRSDPHRVRLRIVAERKRWKVVTQRFMALSGMILDIKKVDKTIILETMIKYLGEMQEKVKGLEEAISKGPTMVVKRKQLLLTYNNDDVSKPPTVISTDDVTASGNRNGHQRDTLPEIEANVSKKSLHLRITCVKRKGVLARIFQEIENFRITVLSSNLITLEDWTLRINVIAQMEAAEGYDKHMRDLVRFLHSTLQVSCNG